MLVINNAIALSIFQDHFSFDAYTSIGLDRNQDFSYSKFILEAYSLILRSPKVKALSLKE